MEWIGINKKNKKVMELSIKDFRYFIGCDCAIYELNDENEIDLSVEPVSSTIEGIDIHLNSVISERVNYQVKQIKPILRKLTSLEREEVTHLNKLWNGKNDNTEDNILIDAIVTDYLTSISIDVFNWIEKDLAIDAAQLPTTNL